MQIETLLGHKIATPLNNTYTAAAKLIYIKLPKYLFFYMALGLNDFEGGKSITKAIGRGELSKCIRLHQNYYVPRHISNRNN
jgi:hypothetical protein